MRNKFLSIVCAIALLCLAVFGGCTKKEDVHLGNVLIFGDSYSTFEGYIPEGYPTWYQKNVDYTDVNNVKDTWWHQLISRTHAQLMRNCSYSGSTICHTGYHGADASASSFVTRLTALANNEQFDNAKVDTVFIYGGLNDYWANAPLGELIYDNWTQEDLYSLYPALTYLITHAKQYFAQARIIVIIEEYFSDDVKNKYEEASERLSVEAIRVSNVSKQTSHPDKAGMDAITEQIITYLKERTK